MRISQWLFAAHVSFHKEWWIDSRKYLIWDFYENEAMSCPVCVKFVFYVRFCCYFVACDILTDQINSWRWLYCKTCYMLVIYRLTLSYKTEFLRLFCEFSYHLSIFRLLSEPTKQKLDLECGLNFPFHIHRTQRFPGIVRWHVTFINN